MVACVSVVTSVIAFPPSRGARDSRRNVSATDCGSRHQRICSCDFYRDILVHTNSLRDLLVFSHLRWGWVYQRPQHLMVRAARDRHVYFHEEPICDAEEPTMCVTQVERNLQVVTPHLPAGLTHSETIDLQRQLLNDWIESHDILPETLWYYTPVALEFTSHIRAPTIVYDCMDELSAFSGAPPTLRAFERQLFSKADVVFTGGISLYEAKRTLHNNVHAMPSCVDLDHFKSARGVVGEHPLQGHLPKPRVGFCGVLDERLDLPLIEQTAAMNPSLTFIFAGPVCKIEESSLPTGDNVRYLGPCAYADLPQLLAGWDIGWMPFALNDATRFISPTKTPEYLAAGLQVVSSPIKDVVRTWGDDGFVRIAATSVEFTEALNAQLSAPASQSRQALIDRTLALHSWDALWYRMDERIRLTAVNAA